MIILKRKSNTYKCRAAILTVLIAGINVPLFSQDISQRAKLLVVADFFEFHSNDSTSGDTLLISKWTNEISSMDLSISGFKQFEIFKFSVNCNLCNEKKCEYIIGFSASYKRFYRLKGFRGSEIRDFLLLASYEENYFEKHFKNEKKNIKKFLVVNSIENMDLFEMYLEENKGKNSSKSCFNQRILRLH